jgi:NAD(P)-dependent dehydrogenase (short-subunit alcohol dehydrogenase family)
MIATHLVLGGSYGIGFAYAKWRATRHGSLALVARNRTGLTEAREKLFKEGARQVSVIEGDLRDRLFRQAMRESFERTEAFPFDSLFIGGPAPPTGRFDTVRPEQVEPGYDTAFAYPLEMIRWSLKRALIPQGEIILLGSSASKEPLLETPFFLSGLFRRALDEVVESQQIPFGQANKRITVWRPQVVWTRLSKTYAKALSGKDSDEDLRDFLQLQFGVDQVPTADDFVANTMATRL